MLLEKEYFDIWMHRIMDMLDRIESKQKPPKMPEYTILENGEKLLDNFDLCRMLHVSKRTLQRYRTQYGLPYQLPNEIYSCYSFKFSPTLPSFTLLLVTLDFDLLNL